VRRRTSPSESDGIGASTVSKFSATGMPAGRDLRRIWRFMAAISASIQAIAR
jgi:hypothetical protein